MSPVKFWIIMGAVIVIGIVLDQVTKVIVQNNLTHDDKISIIGDWVYFTYAQNWGASFGMLDSWKYKNVLFFAITVIGIPVFAYLLAKRRNERILGSIGLALMISGAIGNAIDRFMYSTSFYDGYVRDFIGVKHFAIFNVADSCMCVGIALLLISMLFLDKDRPFGTTEKESSEEEKEKLIAQKKKEEEDDVNKIVGFIEEYKTYSEKESQSAVEKQER